MGFLSGAGWLNGRGFVGFLREVRRGRRIWLDGLGWWGLNRRPQRIAKPGLDGFFEGECGRTGFCG